uniref:Uncharacterized protein n=1 Tax=Panagrolaimus davidi TaxID=227884 RepID=A0A914PC78_9BILA
MTNILFVFADNKFHDIILVFNNEIRCKKVFDLIYRKRAFDEISNEIIYQHFLLPIFNNIAKNSNNTVSKVIKKWIDKLDAPDKESYTKMMMDDKVYHGIYSETESNEGDYDVRPRRKRKFSKVLSDGEQDKFIMDDVTEAKKKNEFIKSDYDFKMVNINGKRQLVKRLLLFPSADKRFCYVFRRNPFKPNILYCIGCRKMRTNVCAKIGQNGELLLQAVKHVCSKARFSAENYIDLQIIRKPYYEILENTNTKTGKVLIVFNPNDLNQCHEFGWRNHEKLFLCFGCRAQAKINCASKENETVEVLKMNHECEYHQYDREKYFKFKNFVLSPDFELRTAVKDGIERKHLVIFDKNDKTKCFIYHFHSSAGFFKCFNCIKQKVNVSAKMLQNSDGENYIVLSNIQHICSSEKYFPQKNEGGVILRPPKIRFLEETSTGLPKLFIFDSDDKDLCYIFSPVTSAERNRYICRGCDEFAHKTSKKRTDKSNGAVYVRLFKNENGEYYIQMKDNQKHLCQPRKYEPEKRYIRTL